MANQRASKIYRIRSTALLAGAVWLLFGSAGLSANTSEAAGEKTLPATETSSAGADNGRHPGQASAITDGFVYQPDSPIAAPRRPWDIAFYQGKYSRTNLGEILLDGHTKYEPAYISVLSLARPLPYRLWRANLEGEGQLVRHTGIQKHLEFNGVVLARITEPFRGTPFSVGIGEGLSFATRNPDLENSRRSIERPDLSTETSRKLLNYLVFELEMALPIDAYRPRAFLRVHHRSGIFGTLCPSICGSNFVSYGVRFAY